MCEGAGTVGDDVKALRATLVGSHDGQCAGQLVGGLASAATHFGDDDAAGILLDTQARARGTYLHLDLSTRRRRRIRVNTVVRNAALKAFYVIGTSLHAAATSNRLDSSPCDEHHSHAVCHIDDASARRGASVPSPCGV